MADFPFGINDSVPGNIRTAGQGVKGVSDHSCLPRKSCQFCNLSVRGDTASGYLLDYLINLMVCFTGQDRCSILSRKIFEVNIHIQKHRIPVLSECWGILAVSHENGCYKWAEIKTNLEQQVSV